MPLLNIFLALFVVLTFTAGIAFLFRGYSLFIQREKRFPLSDFEKAKADVKLSNAETEKVRAQANALAVELEQMKAKCSWAEENVKTLESMINESSQAQSRLDAAQKDLSFLSQKADAQAREAFDVITHLLSENENFQKTLQDNTVGKDEQIAHLSDENQKLKIQADGYVSKLKELEALASASAQTTEKLTAAYEEIKAVRLQNEEKIVQANAALVKLNSDIESLNTQIVEKEGCIKKMTDELLASRQEIALAAKEVEALKAQQQTPAVSQTQNLSDELARLKEANQYLENKEKLLVHKLAQSRAAALSFEKICEELKCQVES